ncbi:hypothetical protein CRUP_010332 [Coryphaenoides rupestris]|nr:hypothetical protein CRUP_010332 [Coryphaenoides rupestris]
MKQTWTTILRPGHERFRTQYRAMFVMNCTVKREEVLRYRTPQERRRSKRRSRRTREQEEVQRGGGAQQVEVQGGGGVEQEEVQGGGAQEQEEVYHPVQCTECSTEVGVVDQDEVFHFFNILASHC